MTGTLVDRSQTAFVITGEGTSYGAEPRTAAVRLQGRTLGSKVVVDYSFHSQ
jgi:hypothetical protein